MSAKINANRFLKNLTLHRLAINVTNLLQRCCNGSKSPLLSSNSLQSFKQIKRKTPEILHFNFLIVLQVASVMSYLSENEGCELTKWWCPSFSNSWPWNGISWEPSGSLRSVRAHFFSFFTLFHWRLTFFDWSFPLMNFQCIQNIRVCSVHSVD